MLPFRSLNTPDSDGTADIQLVLLSCSLWPKVIHEAGPSRHRRHRNVPDEDITQNILPPERYSNTVFDPCHHGDFSPCGERELYDHHIHPGTLFRFLSLNTSTQADLFHGEAVPLSNHGSHCCWYHNRTRGSVV